MLCVVVSTREEREHTKQDQLGVHLAWSGPRSLQQCPVDHTRSCKIDVVPLPQIWYIFGRGFKHTVVAVTPTAASPTLSNNTFPNTIFQGKTRIRRIMINSNDDVKISNTRASVSFLFNSVGEESNWNSKNYCHPWSK